MIMKHGKVVTYCAGPLSIKSHDQLNKWSCEIILQIKKTYLLLQKTYEHEIKPCGDLTREAPTLKVA